MKKILFLLFLTLTYSQIFSQDKKVLFEQFTNASCIPCANVNPYFREYFDSKGDTVISVKYHTQYPGYDPMYFENVEQVNERGYTYYTDIFGVPWLKADGNVYASIFDSDVLEEAFNIRKAVTPKILISVTDQKIAGDSVRAAVNINIPQDLPAGNYKLRVYAVEDFVQYAAPPGTNGERYFPYVFRLGVPDMTGTTIPVSAGSYEYVFTYKINDIWVDSNITTVAFIQNDASSQKEVLNAARGKDKTVSINNITSEIPEGFKLHQNYPNPFNPSTSIKFEIPASSNVSLKVYNSIGKEVASLINERLTAGVYNYNFSAMGLSSGVYIYKLEAGNFKEVKKMMLLK